MKTKKAKEPVKIRFKELADGNKSIYLDFYKDGKRKYEFLKLYIIPEKTPLDKQQNEATMRAANAIKAKCIISLTNGAAGISERSKGGKMLVSDLFDLYANNRAEQSRKTDHSLSQYSNIKVVAGLVEEYKPKAKLSDIDKRFCKGFSEWIQSVVVMGGKHISKGTARTYFSIFNAALNLAVKRELIPTNPVALLEADEKPKASSESRDFLTLEELKQLLEAPCKDIVKQPFIFSCLTGLRFGDIMNLDWSNIVEENGVCRLKITAQKTQKPISIPIPNANNILPQRGDARDNDNVFKHISNRHVNLNLSKWADSAGIKGKRITFHTARHTYATMLLTKGADLYTVSKLLGHSQIRTTQIYAEIIDKKKEEAANLLNGII